MAEEMKKSSAKSILANDTAPKTATKSMDAGAAPAKKEAAPKMEHEAAGKKKHKHTHIEHHENGTHTVRHTPVDGGPDVSYAAQDLDGVHDGMEHHIGEPNGAEGSPQEESADAAAGGQPDAAAGGAAPAAGAGPAAGASPQAV